MAFNSLAYLLFLPCVFLLYWAMGRNWRMQNVLIVVASYVFYGWWDARFLLLIVFTTLASYLFALWAERNISRGGSGMAFSTANIVVNVGILCVFKYYDFFAASFAAMCGRLGFEVHPVLLHLLLPAGISFYTFQAIGYGVDVAKGRLPATRDLVAYAAFISFFPQLVAGPIERATRLMPVFTSRRTFCYVEATEGMRRILLGLFKKMVIADNCAPLVNSVFTGWDGAGGATLVLGALLFSLQIYGDFSGYSDIAVGSARLFGIKLQENFRAPYFACGIPDFWRRWHLSLTGWFRDYVYIPLGGNRRGRFRTWLNVLVVFMLSGLWHGAAWTFVCWGLYHALLFVPSALAGRVRLPVAAGRLLTFASVAVGWVVFRSAGMDDALGYLGRMFTPGEYLTLGILPSGLKAAAVALAASTLLLAAEYATLPEGRATGLLRRLPRVPRRCVYVLMAVAVVVFGGEAETFIYFQF